MCVFLLELSLLENHGTAVGKRLRLVEIFAHPKWLSKCTRVEVTYHKLRSLQHTGLA